jgi:hypothetical protein
VGGAGRGGVVMGGGPTWGRPLLNTPFSSSKDLIESTPTSSGINLPPTQGHTSLNDARQLVDVLHPPCGLSRRRRAIAAGYGEALRDLASRCVN